MLEKLAILLTSGTIACALAIFVITTHVAIERREGRPPMWRVIKRWWCAAAGYRTVVFNVAVVLLTVLEAFDLTRLIDNQKTAAAVALTVAVVNLYLRTATTGPVGRKLRRRE